MTYVRTFILTPVGYRTMKSNGTDLTCKRCGGLLCVGDEVHNPSTNHKGARLRGRYSVHVRRYYHEKCFQEMLI